MIDELVRQTIKIFPKAALYLFLMTYEGKIEGMEAFMSKLKGINKIYSWRDKKEDIKKTRTRSLRLKNRIFVIYGPDSPEYEIKKQIMIEGDNWRD